MKYVYHKLPGQLEFLKASESIIVKSFFDTEREYERAYFGSFLIFQVVSLKKHELDGLLFLSPLICINTLTGRTIPAKKDTQKSFIILGLIIAFDFDEEFKHGFLVIFGCGFPDRVNVSVWVWKRTTLDRFAYLDTCADEDVYV